MNHNPNTDNGSTIDLVFTNCDGQIGIEEAYWSDYKMLYFLHIKFRTTAGFWFE